MLKAKKFFIFLFSFLFLFATFVVDASPRHDRDDRDSGRNQRQERGRDQDRRDHRDNQRNHGRQNQQDNRNNHEQRDRYDNRGSVKGPSWVQFKPSREITVNINNYRHKHHKPSPPRPNYWWNGKIVFVNNIYRYPIYSTVVINQPVSISVSVNRNPYENSIQLSCTMNNYSFRPNDEILVFMDNTYYKYYPPSNTNIVTLYLPVFYGEKNIQVYVYDKYNNIITSTEFLTYIQ